MQIVKPDTVTSSNPKPTLEDVAKLANVSTATISRSINAPDKVAEATRMRINQAIEQLAYTPNFSAKALATSKSNIIGAIIPTMANAMFASGLQSFQEELSQSGVLLLVASSGYDSESEFRQIKTLLAHGADGLLLIGTARPRATLDYLQNRNIPFILSWCFRHSNKFLYAGFDNEKAASAMASHVISLGHRRLAMIGGIGKGNDRARSRIAGVRKAIENHRGSELVGIVEAEYSLNAGADAFDKVMAGTTAPSVVICGNDVLAVGALKRAKALGLTVPTDVSVTGFDDIDLALAADPQLTTVRVPQLEMGKIAARRLLQYVNNKKRPESIEFNTEIVVRDSLAKVSG